MMWKMVAMMRVILIAIDHIWRGRQASPQPRPCPPPSPTHALPYIFAFSHRLPEKFIGLCVAKELQGIDRAVVE